MFDNRQTKAEIIKGGMKLHALYVEASAENERLRAALAICAAPWASKPGLMMDCHNEMGQEFQRRMNVAAKAIVNEQ